MDTSPPGYALVVFTPSGDMRQYYRPTESALAFASPKWSQIVRDEVIMDVIDPETGKHSTSVAHVGSRPAGWTDLEIDLGTRPASVSVFKAPDESDTPNLDGEGILEFDMLEKGEGDLAVRCNGSEIGRYEDGGDVHGRCRLGIPSGSLKEWNEIRFDGDAIIRMPQLEHRGRKYRDARDERLESIKPKWFGEYRLPTWDTSGLRHPCNTLFLGCEFFFHLGI